MKLNFSPVAGSTETLELGVTGDALTVNGLVFDFSALSEGQMLPRGAVGCNALISDVIRQDGQITLTLVLPYSGTPPHEVAFPMPVVTAGDGPVIAPGLSEPNGVSIPGVIDWGQVFAPADAIPSEVSRFQARAALHLAGLLPAVEAAIGAADPLAQLAWADAQVFRRDSPTIGALAAALGMTGAQIDALFVQAAQIQA